MKISYVWNQWKDLDSMPTGQSLLRNQVIYVQGQEEPKNLQFGLIVIYGQLNI